jgi:hypothetical protein
VTEDGTLGGYERVHGRPPAFAGADGRSYTVAAFVDDVPDAAGRFGAALLFVRWSESGERPVGHLETEYLAFGATPDEARAPVLALPLRAIKDHLDRLVGRAP